MDTATTLEKGHGRRERRTLTATTALNGYLDWPGVGQVGQVESVVERDGKCATETRYFITSVPRRVAGAEGLLGWSRGHWTIENSQHWVLDVVFQEDQSRARSDNAAEDLALLRRLAMNLMGKEGTKHASLRVKGRTAGWDDKLMTQILTAGTT